jgi:hypothetical protein
MSNRMTWLGGAAAIALLAAPALAQQKTLKFIPQADLRILDPVWTTQYIVRNHGYLIYDTLFAQNDKFEIKPQSSTPSSCATGCAGMTARRLPRRTWCPRSSAGARRIRSAS